MRRGAFICTAILALGAVSVANALEGKRFSAFSTCKPGANKPDPYCIDGARPTATFIAHNQDRVDYVLCVGKPGKKGKKRKCFNRHTGSAGVPSKVQFSAGKPGGYDLVWKVGGRTVDRDRMKLQKRRVFVNGDSLAEGTRPYLPGALSQWSVRQSVSISRQVGEGVALLRRMGGLPPVVVMQLGTNGDPRATGTFRNLVQETMRIVGPSGCVVWPTIVRPPVAGASYANLNEILIDEGKKRRNLRVVDWVGLVSANPGWLGPDRVHPSATGYRVRAEAIAKQVKHC